MFKSNNKKSGNHELSLLFLINRRSERERKKKTHPSPQEPRYMLLKSNVGSSLSPPPHRPPDPPPGFHMIQYVWGWTTWGSRQSFSNLQATTVWMREFIIWKEESARAEGKPSLKARGDGSRSRGPGGVHDFTLHVWRRRRSPHCPAPQLGFCNTFSCLSVKYEFISGVHRRRGPGRPRRTRVCLLSDLSEGAMVRCQQSGISQLDWSDF